MKTSIALFSIALCAHSSAASFFGPSAYVQSSDSPWTSVAFDYFHLETVEDNLFNSPGATMTTGIVTSSSFGLSSLVDSVDEDDGAINGTNGFNGDFGDSLFDGGGVIDVSFSAGVLGQLPTHAGIVWTDGGGTITFEAFDALGATLGTLQGAHADGSFTGGTAEDRFYGAFHQDGISRIRISNTGGGIEADHLQYGFSPVPEPGTMAALGLGALAMLRRRKR